MATVLVVDDDEFLLSAIGQTLSLHGYHVTLQSSSAEALKQMETGDYTAVISDIRLPGIDGMTLLSKVMVFDRDLPIIMITGHGDVALAVDAIRAGAYDFLEKPVDEGVLLASLQRAVEKRQLILENRRLQKEVAHKSQQSFFQGMVGCHPLMHRLYDVVQMVAREPDPVLISGETGTGKELVAKAIHQIAAPDGPFVGVNMATLPMDIVESELFGHEKGSFTGAITQKTGKLEFARHGTIFFDEICSLSTAVQAKLLRVLEERTFSRVGSNTSLPLQARVIAATNTNLEEKIEAGLFRRDLYYRLNVLSIEIPPLRRRREDINLLVEYFRQEYCRERQVTVPQFSLSQTQAITTRDWPGNIRELRNHVRRLCVFGEDGGNDPSASEAPADPSTAQDLVSLKEFTETTERQYIIEVLQQCGGKVGRAHQVLGLSRKGLYDKINKYAIDLGDLRTTS